MRRSILIASILLVIVAPVLRAHDLFLKLTSYFLAPKQRVSVTVLNGTFTSSENAVTRDRLRDISLVAAGARQRLDTTAWSYSKDNKSSRVTFDVGAAGTYLLGASTRPRELKLGGKEFIGYLKEEGLTDVVAARTAAKQLGDSARERYSKHVKAIFQVGDAKTSDFSMVLGYPAELVPQSNPANLSVGSELIVQCLTDAVPVGGVAVLAGGRTPAGQRIAQQVVRAGSNGTARVKITSAGTWYVKFIKMERRTSDSVDYESRWATLTFAVR